MKLSNTFSALSLATAVVGGALLAPSTAHAGGAQATGAFAAPKHGGVGA